MRIFRSLAIFLALIATGTGCQLARSPAVSGTAPNAPSLVVLVAVDQLRADMLDHYESTFTRGFRRLLDEGYRFARATHDHARTSTGPGHVTLATGVHPARHGVVENQWSELVDGEWRSIYSMQDAGSPILGSPDMPGRSPANIFRGGLADWIVAAVPAARVVSISAKDRAAIGLAARARGEVYWLPPGRANFVTSAYYRSDYPDWIRRFNDETMPVIYAQAVWESRTPPEYLPLSRPDTSAFELDGIHSFFPHFAADRVDVEDAGELNTWRHDETPFPDEAVLALAQAAIAELRLGGEETVDFLGIAFSQTDLVGHRFGPFSREQLDSLLRLDGLLGELITTLDAEVGAGRWVMALSSDHGVLEVPEHMVESGRIADRLDRGERGLIRTAIQEAAAAGAEGEALARAVQTSVSELPFIAAAYTFSDIETAEAHPDSFAALFSRSHSRSRVVGLAGRSGVHLRYGPNILTGLDRSSHGSPYYYDRAVPLIFLGTRVRPGRSEMPVSTVDVAPTLADLANIPHRDDLDGRSVSQLFSR